MTRRLCLLLALLSFACGSTPPPAAPTPPRETATVPWETAVETLAGELTRGDTTAEPLRVVVMPFQAQDGSDCNASDAVVDEITDALARTRGQKIQGVIERRAIDAIQREQQLSQSDLVDPKTAVRLGKLSGATAIVMGTIGPTPGAYVARARLVSVETGDVLATAIARLDVDAIASRGGCGVQPPDVAGRIVNANTVYGRQSVAHKAALYTSVAGLATALVAGTIVLIEAALVAKHCDDGDRCDRAGADAAKTGKTISYVADGALVIGAVGLGVHFLIPPVNESKVGVRLFPRHGGIVGGRF